VVALINNKNLFILLQQSVKKPKIITTTMEEEEQQSIQSLEHDVTEANNNYIGWKLRRDRNLIPDSIDAQHQLFHTLKKAVNKPSKMIGRESNWLSRRSWSVLMGCRC
jgi:hypothetical protein